MKKFSILLLLILITFSSCNPVKSVLNDRKKFEIVAREVVKQGYCITESTIETVLKDTIIYRDVYFEAESPQVLPTECKKDTLIKLNKDISIQIKDGKIKVIGSVKANDKMRTINTTVTVRDRKLESILQEEIIIKEKQLLAKEREYNNLSLRHSKLALGVTASLALIAGAVILFFITRNWLKALLKMMGL